MMVYDGFNVLMLSNLGLKSMVLWLCSVICCHYRRRELSVYKGHEDFHLPRQIRTVGER